MVSEYIPYVWLWLLGAGHAMCGGRRGARLHHRPLDHAASPSDQPYLPFSAAPPALLRCLLTPVMLYILYIVRVLEPVANVPALLLHISSNVECSATDDRSTTIAAYVHYDFRLV